MASDFLFVLCWIALALSAIAMLIGVAVGAAYHPENGVRNVTVLFFAVLFLGGLLMSLRRATGLGARIAVILGVLAGLSLAGGSGYLMLSDPGDALLFLPGVFLGVGLLGMVVAGQSSSKARGRT